MNDICPGFSTEQELCTLVDMVRYRTGVVYARRYGTLLFVSAHTTVCFGQTQIS